MTIAERVAADLTAAMKAQDAPRTSTLRMAKAALKNKEIDRKAPLDDGEAARVLQGLVKQREDSAQQFRRANRPELAEKEEAEIGVLRGYLPAEASDAEIAAAVERAPATWAWDFARTASPTTRPDPLGGRVRAPRVTRRSLVQRAPIERSSSPVSVGKTSCCIQPRYSGRRSISNWA